MAEAKYYVKTPQGRVLGPMTAGDRGNHTAAGCTEVSAEQAQQERQQRSSTPAAPPRPTAPRREQSPSSTASEGASA